VEIILENHLSSSIVDRSCSSELTRRFFAAEFEMMIEDDNILFWDDVER